MTAADELIERCQLARNIPVCFGTYPESTRAPTLKTETHSHFFIKNISIVPILLSDLNLKVNHGLSTLPMRFFCSFMHWSKENLTKMTFGISMIWWESTSHLDNWYFLINCQLLHKYVILSKIMCMLYRFSIQ